MTSGHKPGDQDKSRMCGRRVIKQKWIVHNRVNQTEGTGYLVNRYQRGVNNNLAESGLQTIGYRIKYQERSDGEQEEMTTLNTFPERWGVAHHTHKREKHLGKIYFDELSGLTRHMHAHLLNINDIQSQRTKWVKSGDYDSNRVIKEPNKQLVIRT